MRGFSLIEVIMVVSIMAILAAIAIPGITDMVARRQAGIEVDKVQTEIEKARDDARARLRCIRVTNPTSASLLIEEMVAGATTTTCGATVATSQTKTFNSRAVSMPTAINVMFTAAGSVVTGAEFVTFRVDGKYKTVLEPHQFRIYRLLGLVRKVS